MIPSNIDRTARTSSRLVRQIPHSPGPPVPIPNPSRRQIVLLSNHAPPLIWISLSFGRRDAISRAISDRIPEPGMIASPCEHESMSWRSRSTLVPLEGSRGIPLKYRQDQLDTAQGAVHLARRRVIPGIDSMTASALGKSHVMSNARWKVTVRQISAHQLEDRSTRLLTDVRFPRDWSGREMVSRLTDRQTGLRSYSRVLISSTVPSERRTPKTTPVTLIDLKHAMSSCMTCSSISE